MVRLLLEDEQDKLEITEGIEEIIKNVCVEAVKYEKCDFDCEISVTLVDNEQIREINQQHRNIDSPTDVLSFPMLDFDENGAIDKEFAMEMDDGFVVLGDIVISTERAMEQAEEYNHSFKREIAFLTAHSMLHLFGYDHMNAEEEEFMCSKQEDILNNLEITRDK